MKEKIKQCLEDYFDMNGIDGSYFYELQRTKQAFSLGTMSFEDFKEFDDDLIDELAETIETKLKEK